MQITRFPRRPRRSSRRFGRAKSEPRPSSSLTKTATSGPPHYLIRCEWGRLGSKRLAFDCPGPSPPVGRALTCCPGVPVAPVHRFLLMLRNGEAADPPAFRTEQPDWQPGDVFVAANGRAFRIVDTNAKIEAWFSSRRSGQWNPSRSQGRSRLSDIPDWRPGDAILLRYSPFGAGAKRR